MYKYYLAAREAPREKCILQKKVGKCLRENIFFLKNRKKFRKKLMSKKIILQGIVRAHFFVPPTSDPPNFCHVQVLFFECASTILRRAKREKLLFEVGKCLRENIFS